MPPTHSASLAFDACICTNSYAPSILRHFFLLWSSGPSSRLRPLLLDEASDRARRCCRRPIGPVHFCGPIYHVQRVLVLCHTQYRSRLPWCKRLLLAAEVQNLGRSTASTTHVEPSLANLTRCVGLKTANPRGYTKLAKIARKYVGWNRCAIVRWSLCCSRYNILRESNAFPFARRRWRRCWLKYRITRAHPIRVIIRGRPINNSLVG